MSDTDKYEVWVQDLTDRNLYFNRLLNLKLPEAALQSRPNSIIKVAYDRDNHQTLPFGYTWNLNDQITIAPDEAEIVRQVFALSTQGLSAEKIAKKFDGMLALNGETVWHPSVIREILKNERAYRSGSLSSDSSLRLPLILT